VLRARWPELRWKIVGRGSQTIQRLVFGDPRIEVTGPVDDAVPILAQAQIAVVPVLAGSGTRIKILEAWAAGTPVVSTTIGAEGLEYRDREHLLLADDPDSFVVAASSLLGSASDRSRIGTAGRQLYETRYTWPVAWKALGSIL
jgi:glycosyltransferase involved in cell wall biosynthesis